MVKTVFTVRGTDGSERRVSRAVLERLRMLRDWQLRERGYDPASVNVACRLADGE